MLLDYRSQHHGNWVLLIVVQGFFPGMVFQARRRGKQSFVGLFGMDRIDVSKKVVWSQVTITRGNMLHRTHNMGVSTKMSSLQKEVSNGDYLI